MSHGRLVAILGVTLSLLGSGALLLRADEGGVQSVDAAWAKAMEAGDLEAVVACYSPEVTAWFAGKPEVKGAKEVRAVYQALFAARTVKSVSFSDTHYQTLGDRSVGWGRFSVTSVPKAGGAVSVSSGRFTEVAERRGGRWVYLIDHSSAEPTPAAPRQP
ncbi:MAG: nuclear transport factor 2 family protein [Acidobacteriota bacterium]|nr:nuclear transport factor 2 family protein [Acidobacteriota bacterium]